jgi:riboflavin kinase/FMN adenylyltransferase
LGPDAAPPRLTRLREKLDLFAALGVDRVLVQPFNRKLASMPAEDFVGHILVEGLGVRHLVIGDDTRFGHRRRGDFSLLQRLGEDLGFTVERTETVLDEADRRVSSSRIRAALDAGDMETTGALLGRPYHMSGRVAHGEKRGRSLGFPTANIHINRRQSPVMGIFAVRVGGLDGARLPGVASIGYRPTFGGGQCLLEVHLFDFDRDIYRRHVDVYFIEKLREERRFESVDALVGQMHKDAEQARRCLGL